MIYLTKVICCHGDEIGRVQHRLYSPLWRLSFKRPTPAIELRNRGFAEIPVFLLEFAPFRVVSVQESAVEHKIVYLVYQPAMLPVHKRFQEPTEQITLLRS